MGGRGERAALKYLKKQGLKPVCKNYKTPFGEMDLVLRQGETLVFAEVKTRTRTDYGMPSQAVDKPKRERYRRGASYFLKRKGIALDSVSIRFDVVEVFLIEPPKSISVGVENVREKPKKKGEITVRHIENAFI